VKKKKDEGNSDINQNEIGKKILRELEEKFPSKVILS